MNDLQFADLYDRVVRGAPGGTAPSHADVSDAANRLLGLWCRGQAAMRWAATTVIDRPGGTPANDVQQILSAAARGEDWQTLRDALAKRRGAERLRRRNR